MTTVFHSQPRVSRSVCSSVVLIAILSGKLQLHKPKASLLLLLHMLLIIWLSPKVQQQHLLVCDLQDKMHSIFMNLNDLGHY
ncbi:hypothetical protein D3C76_823270 [compost metagenome]